MDRKIFIPKRLNVGFQYRSDTYTGKLAHVIYYDEKGKLHKEYSWNDWRDHKIPNKEFNNIPIEGFVLNKNIEDYLTRINNKQARCVVYDPRDFEIEITLENLLYILQNTSCIKGKGLEGKFIYGWQGQRLLLIPILSPIYQEIVAYNAKNKENEKKKSFKLSELREGFIYKNKDNSEYIYMGKFKTYEPVYKYTGRNNELIVAKNYYLMPYKSNYILTYEASTNKLWFAIKRKGLYEFVQYKNVPKTLVECISNRKISNYDTIYEEMRSKPEFSPPSQDKLDFTPYTLNQFRSVIKNNLSDKHIPCKICKVFSMDMNQYHIIIDKEGKLTLELVTSSEEDELNIKGLGKINSNEVLENFKKKCKIYIRHDKSYPWGTAPENAAYISEPMTIEEVFKIFKPGYVDTYLKNKKKYLTLLKHIS